MDASENADVLVIDDDRLVRDVLADLLACAGYRVTVAPDGDAGLRLFSRGHHRFVVTDLNMPGCNGWEVARAVTHASRDVTVIVMSASFDTATANAPTPRPRVVTMAKPFDLDTMLDVMARVAAPTAA